MCIYILYVSVKLLTPMAMSELHAYIHMYIYIACMCAYATKKPLNSKFCA